MKRFGVWTLAVLIAIMDFGCVRLSFAQSEDDFLPVPISGASGRNVRANVLFAAWSWTAPVAGPVTFDTRGTGFDTLLYIYDDETEIASNFDLDDFTLAGEVRFTAQQGRVYEVVAIRFDGSSEPGTIVLNWQASPSGGGGLIKADDFDSSITVSGASGQSKGSSIGAGKEIGEPNHAGSDGGASVWWTWTAPATGLVTFDTRGSNFDTLLAIYTGTSLNRLLEIASNDDASDGTLQSEVRFSALQGQTYHVAVDGYGGKSGTVVLNWQAAPPESISGSDDFRLGTLIDGASGRSEGSNVGASIESGEPKHADNSGGASVWWVWTAPTTDSFTFHTRGSDIDTLLAVYTGDNLDSLVEVASNDDDAEGGTLQSAVRFSAQQGETYHIAVDGYGGATGIIVLNWQNDLPNPTRPTVALSDLTPDPAQGRMLVMDYSGPEFDAEDLQIYVGYTQVEGVVIGDQIHVLLPMTERGKSVLELYIASYMLELVIDIEPAPTIAAPDTYVAGVADDLITELGVLEGDWGSEIDILIGTKQALMDLEEDELYETAILLKQNIEPALTLLTSPVVAAYDEDACNEAVTIFLKKMNSALASWAFSTLAKAIKKIKIFQILSNVATMAEISLVISTIPDLLDMSDVCTFTQVASITSIDDPLTSQTTIIFTEFEKRDFSVTLSERFTHPRRATVLRKTQDVIESLYDLKLNLNVGALVTIFRAPQTTQLTVAATKALNGKIDNALLSLEDFANYPDREEPANHLNFSLTAVSDPDIGGFITGETTEDRLVMQFFLNGSGSIPRGGLAFTFTLSLAPTGEEIEFSARLLAAKAPEPDPDPGPEPEPEPEPGTGPGTPGGQHSGRCISGNSVQHTLVDGHVASGHQITRIAPAPSVAGLPQGFSGSKNSDGRWHGRRLWVSGNYVSIEWYDNGTLLEGCAYRDGEPSGFFTIYAEGEKEGVRYWLSGNYWSFETYNAGTLHGPSGAYRDGEPSGFFTIYAEGEKEGVRYWLSGNYWSFETYNAGTLHGPYGSYRNGRKDGCFGSYTNGNRNPDRVCYSNGIAN